jgi:hypothetical protein
VSVYLFQIKERNCEIQGHFISLFRVKFWKIEQMKINKLQGMAEKFLFVTLLLTLAACGPINKPFNPIDSTKTYKPSSIAVISGSDHDGDMKLVEFITQGLTERSTFRVLSQDEIAKRLPNYPLTISIRNDIKNNDEKAVWFHPSEKGKLNAIQARLKVDYLFLVWNSQTTLVTTNRSTTYYVYPIGNLIEYPGAQVLASTRTFDSSFISPLALFRPADYYIVDALKSSAENIVDEFLDVTNSKKH